MLKHLYHEPEHTEQTINNMNKQDVILTLFTPEEREDLLKLPDQWEKRNRNIVNRGVNERYMIKKDGTTVDLYNQSFITLRTAMIRMSELLTYAKNHPNDRVLGMEIRTMIMNLEKEFNISEIE